MSCLCGHFEWCEFCRPKADDPEVLRKMTAKDWARSSSEELPRHCACRTRMLGARIAEYWSKRLQELILEDLKKEFGDETVSEPTPKNP